MPRIWKNKAVHVMQVIEHLTFEAPVQLSKAARGDIYPLVHVKYHTIFALYVDSRSEEQ
jgi:hypothetical protein